MGKRLLLFWIPDSSILSAFPSCWFHPLPYFTNLLLSVRKPLDTRPAGRRYIEMQLPFMTQLINYSTDSKLRI